MKPPRETLNEAITAAYARAARAARSASRAPGDVLPIGDQPPAHRDPLRPSVPRPLNPHLVPDVLGAVLQNAEAAGPFTTFARVVRATGLVKLPRGLGLFTLFAPTNRAFARLAADERDALFADPARLARLLARHLVARRVRAPRGDAPTVAMTIDGRELIVTAEGARFRVNGARLVKPHIHTSNGTVRGIDTLLQPY